MYISINSFENYVEDVSFFMDINDLKDKFRELNLQNQLSLEEMPELDLYMDQVIQLFDNKFNECKRNKDDKALTKTMINNYAKGKLLMPIKNKKYSKEHLILMSLIYNFKTSISISDIKESLNIIVDSYQNKEEYPLRELYQLYLNEYKDDLNDIEKNIEDKFKKIEKIENIEDEFTRNFILLSSFINMSNMYRKLSEKLIDDYFSKL